MTRVGISPNLVAKLKKAYPKAIIGVKDSSGSAENTATLLADYPCHCGSRVCRGTLLSPKS